MMACDCRGCLVAAGEENPSTKIMLRAESDQIFNLLFLFCRWPNKSSAGILGDAGKQMLDPDGGSGFGDAGADDSGDLSSGGLGS